MKIVIVGPGAMGCLFGAFLSRSGESVFLLDKLAWRAEIIKKEGISVEGISGTFSVKDISASSSVSSIEKADLVIIATKSYATRQAVESVLSLIDNNTLVLTLQNGLGNFETISEFVPEPQIIAGITAQGATLLAPGRVRHAGRGETVIGPLSKERGQKAERRLNEIADIFKRAGFETKIAGNLIDLIWSKLVINVGINALTAISGLNNGRLLEFRGTKKIMQEAVEEAVLVAQSIGIKVNCLELLKKTESVATATAGNVSSMLQDILKRRRTEIDFINGAIVKKGKELGISTPVNSVLVDIVKTIESSYDLRVDRF